ncbi:MAG: DUF547 domain-containing protein [Bacteroidota bacterium]
MKSIFLSLSLIFGQYAYAQNAIEQQFFDQTDVFLKANVQYGRLDYGNLKETAILDQLVKQIADIDLSSVDPNTKIAFYINAYNLLIINEIEKNLPTSSVKSIPGFFDRLPIQVGEGQTTFNQLEKQKISDDPRYHFALVCGALDCPPLADFAFRPEQLEAQLETQTRNALNHPRFIRVSGDRVGLSEIFRWYSYDFGNSKKAILAYINQYREAPLPEDVYYYNYDWSLNAIGTAATQIDNNSTRYVVSKAIPKGTTETKVFNNLYTQRTERDENNNLTNRASYFTSWWSFLYGVNDRFNFGFDLRYRRVNETQLPSSALDIFDFSTGRNRSALSHIGPKIRWAPTERLPNFSVQSAFWIPTAQNLQGTDSQPFLDWDSYIWWTQFFNDFPVGSRFSLFTEVDLLWEDIGTGQNNRISTPATAIFSYFPHPQLSVYGLASASPYWYKDLDIFVQSGIGAKYQFTPQVEIEVLYTWFTNGFLWQNDGRAATYNIGFRYNHW